MKPHILINIKNDSTELCFVNAGEKVHTHIYEYGYNHGENKHLFLEGIMYMLEQINTIENIPATFRLKLIEDDGLKYVNSSTRLKEIINEGLENNSLSLDNIMRHKIHWYKALLENYNYTQFDTEGNARPCVIIDSDERYKKANKLGLKV